MSRINGPCPSRTIASFYTQMYQPIRDFVENLDIYKKNPGPVSGWIEALQVPEISVDVSAGQERWHGHSDCVRKSAQQLGLLHLDGVIGEDTIGGCLQERAADPG